MLSHFSCQNRPVSEAIDTPTANKKPLVTAFITLRVFATQPIPKEKAITADKEHLSYDYSQDAPIFNCSLSYPSDLNEQPHLQNSINTLPPPVNPTCSLLASGTKTSFNLPIAQKINIRKNTLPVPHLLSKIN